MSVTAKPTRKNVNDSLANDLKLKHWQNIQFSGYGSREYNLYLAFLDAVEQARKVEREYIAQALVEADIMDDCETLTRHLDAEARAQQFVASDSPLEVLNERLGQ